jgi:glycosyltransferase involved in cell wall biosynthesis
MSAEREGPLQAPTFTVVMPAYNTEDTIDAAIRSVLAQTRPDFELVVVDDGSTDGTAALVEALAGDIRVRLVGQENRGAAAARNAGVAAGRGRYVSFVDSDDLWMPTYLEVMGSLLESAPDDVGFAYTNAWILDPDSRRIGKASAMASQHPPSEAPSSADALLLELLERNFIYNAVTVKRDALDQAGPFDESFRAAIDYDMWLRLAAHGYGAVTHPQLLAVYRRYRPGAISTNYRLTVETLGRAYERVATELPVSERVRDAARRRSREVDAELAKLAQTTGIAGAWRTRIRPSLGRLKRAVVRPPDEWLAAPPPEVASAFPDLFGGSSDRAPSATAPADEPV